MHECLELGHIRKAEKEEVSEAVYLVHHAVIREEKGTSRYVLYLTHQLGAQMDDNKTYHTIRPP